MTIYMHTTRDILELPLAVADTPRELARMTGRTPNSVSTMMCKKYPGWLKVEVPDDEEEEPTSRN